MTWRLIIGLQLALSAVAARAEPPNILFLLTDDQAFDAVNALGWSEVETPHMDKLVRRGVTFTHAYNQGSWTGAVCVASRTMLFTGQTLWHAHRDRDHLGERYVARGRSWPQRMQAAGYRTGMTGKWHVSAAAEKVFDEVRHLRGGMPRDQSRMYDRPHPGQHDPFDPADPSLGGYWSGGKHWSEVVADDAIAMLKAPAGDTRPFFLYVAFNAPHDPRQAPREYVDRYPYDAMSIPSSFQPRYPYAEVIGSGPRLRDERLAPFPRTEYAVRVHRAEYAAIISHLDAQIGRILDALDEAGVTERTRIIFTSDHGLAVGRHGLLGKQNMYDHSVRVPLVIAGPGIPQGHRIHRRVYLQSVAPTTLDWAGASTDGIEFESLAPLLDDAAGGPDSSTPQGTVYGAYLDRQRMITLGDRKLIVYPTVPKLRLYDLADDPAEVVDLADRPEHRDAVAKLLRELKRQQGELDDPLELPDSLLAELGGE